ncbi:hypothetical protein RJ639_006691 [Escallonia herrerae]|uniref:RNase III domain-containing protein n=1 Tax=Escallonia herrerae TaxID=1293975 RepID=A0AA88VYA5_9ASTE|nr:hypothetical protein RJ639_006691 [Escallonia herrerae]
MWSPAGQGVACDDMASSVRAVEDLLNYRFKDKKLLEAALTHPSYADAESYQRLAFLGDAVLRFAISDDVFLDYPHHQPGQLSDRRDDICSTVKLARVAVHHDLYRFVRRKSVQLDETVKAFVEPNGGSGKAPKVLADIVESVAGAVYVFSKLLEPIVTLDALQNAAKPNDRVHDAGNGGEGETMGMDGKKQNRGEGVKLLFFILTPLLSPIHHHLHQPTKALPRIIAPLSPSLSSPSSPAILLTFPI